jgi:HK97 gp10 family phage protein
MKAEFKNLNSVLKALDYNKEKMERLAELSVDETARFVERTAKKYHEPNVDTGFLRSSIHTELDKENSFTRRVVADTDYARYVEFGTRRNRAYPFMIPAGEDAERELKMLLLKAIRRMGKEG